MGSHIVDQLATSLGMRDEGPNILCYLSAIPTYQDDCIELLLEQIEKALVNQVPINAERTAAIITEPYKRHLI